MSQFKPNSGIVLRRGRRWGAASLEWAGMALDYATPLKTVLSARKLDLLLWGDFTQWEAPDGSRIWGGPSDEIEGLALDDIYRDGDFAPGLARTWPLHQFVRVGPDARSVDVLLGRFYSRGSFYAERNGDIFIAPELKAFSSVRAFKSIRPFPRGHCLHVDASGAPLRFEPLCDPFTEPETYPEYDEACRQCRQLMEDAVDKALEELREPYVLALSGGMDSCLLAYLLANRGVRPLAYNVWFDRGRETAPRDVTFAREVARELDLELREIRVTPETVRSILAETIYLGECPNDYQLDNAIYHIPFLRELKRLGVYRRLTGNGVDNAFAGYHQFTRMTTNKDFRRLYLDLLEGAKTRHISAFNAAYGTRNSAPFRTTPLLRFALGLPVDYLADREEGGYRGKRIVRDAFRGVVPESILEQNKRLPGQVNDATDTLVEMFGGSESRQQTYRAVRAQLLAMPDLRRMPLWVFRAGVGRHLMEKRRRRGEEMLNSALRR